MRHSSLCCSIVVAGCSISTAATAQVLGEAAPASQNQPEASPSTTPGNPVHAELVFVGGVDNDTGLSQRLVQLLGARGIGVHVRRQVALSEQDLSYQRLLETGIQASVWILQPNARAVRLVFADPALQRFLLRDLPLPQGMDELGRETLGQVIESSVTALLEGASELSRADVQIALRPNLAAATGALTESVARRRPVGKSADRIRQRLGVTYELSHAGRDLGMLHGPGLLYGLEIIQSRYSWLFATELDVHFTQHAHSSNLELAMQSSTGWLLAGWRMPTRLAAISAIGTLGVGLDGTRVAPKIAENRLVTPSPSFIHFTPWFRIGAGVEWGDAPLVMQLGWATEVSPARTHYDVTLQDGTWQTIVGNVNLRLGLLAGLFWR